MKNIFYFFIKKTSSFIFLFSFLLLFFLIEFKSISQQLTQGITYQGKLIENGRPFTGSQAIFFELIDDTGNIPWSETQNVIVQDGLYSVILGNQNPFIPSFFVRNPSLSLRVTINGNILSPNVPLQATPYAHAAGGVIRNSIGTLQIRNGTILPIDIASGGNDKLLGTNMNGRVTWLDRSNAVAPSGSARGDLIGTYPNPEIGSEKVDSDNILDATITNIDISANAAIEGTKVNPNFGNQNISTTGKVTTNSTVGTDAANTLTTKDYVDNQISTATVLDAITIDLNGSSEIEIVDNAVTTTKITNGTILEEDLSDNAVTTLKINDNAVTTAKIANGTILEEDLSDNAITLNKLQNGTANQVFATDAAGNPILINQTTLATVTNTDNQDLTFSGNTFNLTGDATPSFTLSSTTPITNQILTWNGSNWIAQTPLLPLFTIAGQNLYRQVANEKFIIGSDQMNHTAAGANRMFYDKSNGAFRVGGTTGTNWDTRGSFSFAAGQNNRADGQSSVVSGGDLNIASGIYSTIGGGILNQATNIKSTVGGGIQNVASAENSTIAGGENNLASGINSTITGGRLNIASGGYSTVAGGENNSTEGNYSFAFGRDITNQGNFSTVIGSNIELTNIATGTFAIGDENTVSTTTLSLTNHFYSRFRSGYTFGTSMNTLGNVDNGIVITGGTNPTMGIRNLTPNNAYALDVNGNVNISGNLTVSGIIFTPNGLLSILTSDRRYKKEILTLNNSLSTIQKLRGTSYYWKDQELRGKKWQFGVIAQEIEEVFPNLVHTDSKGYKAVNYIGLVPVLIEATKEQQTIIETQEEKILKLEKQVNQLKEVVLLLNNENDSNSLLSKKVEVLEKQLTSLVNQFSEITAKKKIK